MKILKQHLLYLASKSPRRSDLLKEEGVAFKVVDSDYEEVLKKGVSPEELVLEHAYGKANAAMLPKKARFVMGADTTVAYKGEILGKPKTRKQAVQMLSLLSGHCHDVFTGMVILDLKEKSSHFALGHTKVYFKKLSQKRIENYLKQVNVYDKAGSYGIQEKPELVREIKGSYSNVVGLCLEDLRVILKEIELNG